MDRMKTFFKYFLALVILYVIVDIATYFTLKSTYIARDYEVNAQGSNIEITEFKTTVLNGYLKGTINNTSEEVITGKALKFDYYSKNNVLMGTKYFKIDNFLVGETKEFESRFNFDNVENVNFEKIMYILFNAQNSSDFDFSLDDFAKDDINWFVLLGALIVVFG